MKADLTKKAMRTRAQVRAKRKRSEAKVIKAVREEIVWRDGMCRYASDVLRNTAECSGRLEMAHLGEWKRFRTRGQSPSERHSSRTCLLLCNFHHRAYDAHAFDLEYGPELGADGPLKVKPSEGRGNARGRGSATASGPAGSTAMDGLA